MKKTLITLFALAGTAMASTVITGNDLTWDISTPYKDCTTVTNGNLTYSNGGWLVNGPTGSLTQAITLEQNQMLTFSYSFDFNSSDSIITLALVNSNGAVVMGKTYGNNVRLGTTTETGSAVARGYAFADTNNKDYVANITEGYTDLGTVFIVNSGDTVNTNNVTFTVAYDTSLSQFVGTLEYGGKSADVNLGETFSVNAVTATFDGASAFVANVNDIQLEVTTIPEPTTATLSLLALAGLAVRRRK